MHRNDAIKCEARDEMKAEAFNYSIEWRVKGIGVGVEWN